MSGLKPDKGLLTRGKRRGWTVLVSGHNDGFTIVELLVSMVILLFVALAMMQTAMMTMEANARNVIRDEGVRLASEKLNELKTVAQANLNAQDGVTETVNVQLRNMTISYTVTYGVTTIAANEAARIEVTVKWNWRQQDYDATLSTIRALT